LEGDDFFLSPHTFGVYRYQYFSDLCEGSGQATEPFRELNHRADGTEKPSVAELVLFWMRRVA